MTLIKMNFSEVFRHSRKQCKISPSGRYLWSEDSKFLLCSMFKRGIVQVWWLEDPVWQCKIDEGASGLTAARWSPDSRFIITTADFHLRLTIWSLMSKTISYIKHSKLCKKGLDFSQDGQLMVLAERRSVKDFVSVFRTRDWTLQQHFWVATNDLDSLQLSPDSTTIAVYESCLQYGVFLYSVDGAMLGRYSAYDNALGIRTACWTSTSQFLAVGSYDQKVRVLNNVTWKPSMVADHPCMVDGQLVVVYKEIAAWTPGVPKDCDELAGSLFNGKSKYEIMSGQVDIPMLRPDVSKADPKIGVNFISFSPDCSYMCTRNDNMNKTVWLWDMRSMKLATVLIQDAPIKTCKWDPCQCRLALCTGSKKLFMWSLTGCLAVDVPVEGGSLMQAESKAECTLRCILLYFQPADCFQCRTCSGPQMEKQSCCKGRTSSLCATFINVKKNERKLKRHMHNSPLSNFV